MGKAVFCLVAVVAPSIACGGKSNLYPVSGKVLYKGSPAAGATVFFQRHGAVTMNEPMIMGIAGEDGSFALVCGSLGEGAPAGEYDVLIEWKRNSGPSKGKPVHGPDKLKGRYADPKQPRLRTTVKAERNDLAPFDLTP